MQYLMLRVSEAFSMMWCACPVEGVEMHGMGHAIRTHPVLHTHVTPAGWEP
jgi:hypothetical protein